MSILTRATEADAALENFRGLAFAKGHGTGNDFILVTDAHSQCTFGAAQVAALCHRRLGIGGDGFIRAVRTERMPEGPSILAQEPGAHWFMDYHNADGSTAQMCGNGVRVFVEYLVQEGLLSFEGPERVAIGTRAGAKYVRAVLGGYAVDMGRVAFTDRQRALQSGFDSLVTARGERVARPGLRVDMGNPHVVVALPSEQELERLDLTEPPTVEPPVQEGVNVEFVVPTDPHRGRDGQTHVRMRVHERGSAETFSCGTGACAAAAAVRAWAGTGAGQLWDVQVRGGVLQVRFDGPGLDQVSVELAGPATIVARGVIGAEA